LNIGEISKPKATSQDIEASSRSDPSKSAQKYSNISNNTDETGDAYARESTVASVSNVGMNRENSRPTSELVMRENFENF
jgi:hypothetical protein